MEQFITIGLTAALIYLCLGLLFAIPFILKGMTTVDETTKETGLGFKLIILPGVVLLWVYLLIKWIKA